MKTTLRRPTKKMILRLITSFLGLSVVFLCGSLNENTDFERISEYSSQVVKNNTQDKRYCAISFDAPNKPGDYYSNELSNLFDVFRSGVVTYTSAMDVNKENNITLSGNGDSKLSLVFIGAVGTTSTKDEETGHVEHRHYKYNFDTMFDDPVYNGSEYDKKHAPIIYLSQKQANNILESKNITKENGDEYSEEQYASLIQTEVTLNINGDDCQYCVWNIFYNRGFYYEGVSDVLGEYSLTSYYQPKSHDLRQEHKSIYFFNEYTYYNQYLMRYLNERFADDSARPLLVSNNIIKDVNSDYLLSFFHNESIASRHWAYTMLIVIGAALLGFSIFLVFNEKKDTVLFSVLTTINLLLPYFIFKIIYLISGDVIFFSRPSCKWNAAFVVLYFLLYLYRRFVPRKNIKKGYTTLDFYELTV